MRKHLKTLVSVFTAVVMIISITMSVSAREVLKTGTVDNQTNGYSYTYEYYDDNRLILYPTTSSLTIDINDLDYTTRTGISNKTVLVINVSNLCTVDYGYKYGHLSINGINCPINTIFITGSTLSRFDSMIFENFYDIQQVNFPKGTELSWIEIFDCDFVNFPDFNFVELYNMTVSGCRSLTRLSVPEYVLSFDIEDSDSLASIELNETLEFFQACNCPLITDLDIPDTLRACHLIDVGISDIYVPSGCYFTINSKSLTSATLEEGRTDVNMDMFRLSTNLTNVNIPDGVTNIGINAFALCFNLSNVILPSSVETIEGCAFLASGIQSINIPSGVTKIEYATFRSCDNLSFVVIPTSVSAIEYTAFDYCPSLSDVYYEGSRAQWEDIFIFDGVDTLASPKTINDLFGDAELHFGDFIVTQPEDYEGPIGSNAVFNVIPEGDLDDYTYQWQFFGTEDWIDLTVDSATTPVLEIPITEESADWLVRCVVRDVTGRPSFSNSAAIVATESTLRIIDQSDVYYGMPGEMAELYVNAEGEGLKYQWQVLKKGVWTNCSIKDGAKTPMLFLEIKESRDGSQYRCVITDKYGSSVTSDVATLYMTKLFVIESQPEDCSGYAGDIADFHIEVYGEGVKYQWQILKNGTWTNCSINDGAKTDTLTLLIKDSRDGSVYHCVVTNKYGETIISDEVTLSVLKPLSIKTQPEDFSGATGETAVFHVEAQGEGLKYQWQVYKNGAWTNCSMNDGAKTDTLSLEIKESRNGCKYHCIVSDMNGDSVTTDEVTLTISREIYISAEPEYCFGDIGDYATFVVEAEGDGLKYQWQVWKNGAWTNCSINDGAKTDSLTLLIKESRDGSKYHCVITDKYGNVATTREVYLYIFSEGVPVPEAASNPAEANVIEAEDSVVIEETVEVVEVEETETVVTVETPISENVIEVLY